MEKKVMNKTYMQENRDEILAQFAKSARKFNKTALLTKKEKKVLGIGKDEGRAIAKNIRIAPRKVNVVVSLIKGKPIDEALQITNKAVAQALDGLPPEKMHCSLLAEEGIKAAIEDYQGKKSA